MSNSRFQPAQAAGLTAAQLPRLKLKWAFGFPSGVSANTQPTIVSGRVFAGSETLIRHTLILQRPLHVRATVTPARDASDKPWRLTLSRIADFSTAPDGAPVFDAPIDDSGGIDVPDQAPGTFRATVSDSAGNPFDTKTFNVATDNDAPQQFDSREAHPSRRRTGRCDALIRRAFWQRAFHDDVGRERRVHSAPSARRTMVDRRRRRAGHPHDRRSDHSRERQTRSGVGADAERQQRSRPRRNRRRRSRRIRTRLPRHDRTHPHDGDCRRRRVHVRRSRIRTRAADRRSRPQRCDSTYERSHD